MAPTTATLWRSLIGAGPLWILGPAATGSILLFVQPIFTLVFSAILLAERPSPFQLAGVGLVLGGVAVAAVPVRRRPAG